ncbi:hypothetical protein HX794_15565 [Pseudomonas costantinii]|uniref:hypothetical protein n=1 Tax=Pseudomonas costantinii TaxID=168469 RepID=UPI0015A0E3C3|nr:hypothetical protein [Pseudomonas costantinii]NVZ21054.1 hypothetical protein [Pseudomonas costantinii]
MTVNTINVAGFGSAKNAAPQANDNVNSAPSARSESISPADTEASRAAADARLQQTYLAQPSSGARLSVPAESTLGRWLEALSGAVNSSVFKRLEQVFGGKGAFTHIDHTKGEIWFDSGYKKINMDSPELNDLPGGKALFENLMVIARKLAPSGVFSRHDAYTLGALGKDTVDSNMVQQFLYGPGPKALPDSHVPADILSQTGEAETRHNLLAALKKHIETPGTKSDMESIAVEVAPHSVYWRADQPQPFTMNLKQLIMAYGLFAPTTLEALANLERVLFAPSLSVPSAGDYGGLLSKGVPLSQDAQKKIIETVSTWKVGQTQVPLGSEGKVANLFDYLKRSVPESLRGLADSNPQAFLNAMIDTPQARALGKQLQEAIGALPTATSAQEALLAALVLEVDPAGGLDRNNLAGYNLRQQDNKGRSPAEIAKRFEAHLQGPLSPEMAKVAAFQLLAMAAPEFLVKDMPDTLVYGTLPWAAFSAGISLREQELPGSTVGQTYNQIRQRDVLEPVTAEQEYQSKVAALQSVIDWGIANGVIKENSEGYSDEVIEKASAAMQKLAESTVETLKQVAAAVPTRRELALAELTKVYGTENAHLFEKKIIMQRSGYNRKDTSLLDLYMSGKLYRVWGSKDPVFPTSKLLAGLSQLPKIKEVFEQAFDDHTDSFGKAAGALLQHQILQLPDEDRKRFELGQVSMMHVGESSSSEFPKGSEDHPLFKHFGRGAVLIDTVLNGESVSYVYSPILGKILKQGEYISGVPEGWRIRRGKRPEDPLWGVEVGGKFFGLKAHWAGSRTLPASKSDILPSGLTSSERIKEIGGIISLNYKAAIEEFREAAKGETDLEKTRRKQQAFQGFVLSLVPFHDFIKSIVIGDKHEAVVNGLFDFVGLILPGLKGGAGAVKLGVGATTNALKFVKEFAKAGLKAANPVGSIYDAGSGLFKLGKTAIKTLPTVKLPSFDFDSLRSMSGRSGSWNIPHGGYKQTIADGTYRPLGEDGSVISVVASQKDGKWFALDPNTLTPYGPELKKFTPITVKELDDLRLDVGSSIKTVDGVKSYIDEQGSVPSGQSLPPQPAKAPEAEGEQKSNAA